MVRKGFLANINIDLITFKDYIMANKKQTGKALATKASKILRTKSSSEIQKTLAG
jgi:hypothetical protein